MIAAGLGPISGYSEQVAVIRQKEAAVVSCQLKQQFVVDIALTLFLRGDDIHTTAAQPIDDSRLDILICVP
jgi:hypothetical protein